MIAWWAGSPVLWCVRHADSLSLSLRCRVPRTPDPSGVSVVLDSGEFARIREASTVLSPLQRAEREADRNREREAAQVSHGGSPTPTLCLGVCSY